MPGDSGSPILLLQNEAATLVGIHTAIEQSFEPGVVTGQDQHEASRQALLKRLLHPRWQETPNPVEARLWVETSPCAGHPEAVAGLAELTSWSAAVGTRYEIGAIAPTRN
jgi:hypothetical protein